MTNKRKANAPPKDFKKEKKKVGRKLKPTNYTNIEFKTKGIYMAHQNLRTVDTLESNWVTSRNIGLQDIFPKLKHYNVKTVVSAMKSLLELVTLHPIVLKVYLGKILNEISHLLLMGEDEIHAALYNFLSYSLPKISSASITPFISLLMAYLTSGMTHLIGAVRRYSLKILSKFLEHFPIPISQYAVRVMPNICYIFMLSRTGVLYKGARYRSLQQLCVTVLDNYLSVLFENNKLGIPSSKKVNHTHTHNHMKMNLTNINSSSSQSTGNIYFSNNSSEKAQYSFDNVDQKKLHLLNQLLTRKMAVQDNLEEKTVKLDAEQLLEVGDEKKVEQEDNDNKPSELPSLRKLLQEEMQIKVYNLEDEESIAEFFKLIFHILVEVWIEIFEEQRASAASHHIQTEYVLTVIKSVLDIAYQLLYAFEHTQQGSQTKNINSKIVNKALKKSLNHFVTKLPLQLSSKIRQTTNSIDRTNASLLSMLSFAFGKFSTEKESSEITYKEWELVYLKQFSYFLSSAESLNLHDEDFAKLLGSFYRMYKYLPPSIGAQLWKHLTSLFVKQGAYSSKQQLILEFFANVGLKDESITPPPDVIEQWVAVLVPMLCQLDEKHYELSKHILNVLLGLAKNPKFQSFILKQVNQSIVPFYYDEEKKQFGPFVNLPKYLQSLSLQLIYYFDVLPPELMKQISRACCNTEKRLNFDLLTQVIEVVRHHTNNASKQNKLKPSVHISFLCTILCFVCSPTGETNNQIGLVGVGDVIQEIIVSLQDYSTTIFSKLVPFLRNNLEKQVKTEKPNITLLGALLQISAKTISWTNMEQIETTNLSLIEELIPKALVCFLKHTILQQRRSKSSSIITREILISYYPTLRNIISLLDNQISTLEPHFVLDIILVCMKVALSHYHTNKGESTTLIQQIEQQCKTLFEKNEFVENEYSSKKNQILGLLKMNQ
ncbi:predicted protein [Naegleria gruberi]|uniref:Predicted protein n=1 Tax=Naegleria gruberi TaxID=5762 RepID=D2UXC8_NAEGR|nr:uncharacterized protein NAEGRDRAFT_61079 [Naegleria gruberi]EFC50262.1 predicted protein [Naegleria gruberi]|eukprot:XP_002683006.1 predicted protein [Naegleria gruberi strain NEG-M]